MKQEDDGSVAPPRPALSRRFFLQSGLTAAAAAGIGTRAGASPQAQQVGGGPGVAKKNRDDILTLVNHATQGFSQGEYREAKALGFEGYLERQLDPDSIDDTAMDSILTQFPTLGMTPKELFDTYGPSGPNGGVGAVPVLELRNATVLRSIFSKRQLFERMVQFWNNHFNVYHWGMLIRYLKTKEDSDVMRAHALGNFGDLLEADAKSSAMIIYLNNNANIVGTPNENFAREVMELHTLGVGNGYNEHDIQELARVFTGWNLVSVPFPDFGNFEFVPGDHDATEKTVLGQLIPAGGGVDEGETMLAYLASHENTAAFVTGKMATWLLSYDPPEALRERFAQTFIDSGGDIKAVIREILSPQTFHQHHPGAHPKLKRPRHLLTSILRAGRPSVNPSFGGLVEYLASVGHVPFLWPTPDGYPDEIPAWGNGVMPRFEFAAKVFNNDIPGVEWSDSDLMGLLGGAPPTEAAGAIDKILTGGAMSDYERARVQEYIDRFPELTPSVLREAFSLAASAPSFQYY